METKDTTKDSTAEGVIQFIKEVSEEIVPQLFHNWIEIGYDEKTMEKFGSEVKIHSANLLKDMLVETQSRKQRLFKDIGDMSKTISQLSNELDIEIKNDYGDDVPLLDVEARARADLKKLEMLKEDRLKKYKQLLEKEKEICQVLGMKAVGLEKSLPSEKELRNFQVYLSNQEDEVIKLKHVFQKFQSEIVDMMAELSYEPIDQFEKIICHDYENFVYSGTNMTKLRDFRDKLKEEINSLKELADNKRRELIHFWDNLGLPEEKYKKFLESNSGFDTRTLTALNEEIKRCKEARKENMANYIKKVRKEIIKWWDICRISQTERDAFKPLHYETYTEETLAIHEMELQKLQLYYEKNEKIFEMLKQQNELWEKLKELLLFEDNPDRYTNRGGLLLGEEKQRKIIDKTLPKIVQQLEQLLAEYEEQNGKPFLIDGLTCEEFREHQIQCFNEEKENAKEARARAKDQKKSAKKTPLSASRRNLALTPVRNIKTSGKHKSSSDGSPNMSAIKKKLLEKNENSKEARARAKNEKTSAKKTPLSASRRILALTPLRNSKTSVKRKISSDVSPNTSNNKKRLAHSEQAHKRGTKPGRRSSLLKSSRRRLLDTSVEYSPTGSATKKTQKKK